MKSLLIGCGNLGKIILDGFYKTKKNIIVFDNNSKVREKIKNKYKKIELFECLDQIDWRDIEYIMICVKPNSCKTILKEIKKFCNKKHLVISFVAGLRLNNIKESIESKSKVLRIMPNIFIESNNSATALFSKDLNEKYKKKIIKDFSHFGVLVWVEQEERIDFFTAMFGGGPAYFFLILECLSKINKKNGIENKDSILLITSLIEGTLSQIKRGNINFKESINKVASKGGTTEEALKIFNKKNALNFLFEKAIDNAKKKSLMISRKMR